MPADGTVGEWVVGGQTIQAAPETKMDFKHGSAKKGSYIKVERKISESGEYCYISLLQIKKEVSIIIPYRQTPNLSS